MYFSSLTTVKKRRYGEHERDDGRDVKEEEDEEDEPVGVVEHFGAVLPRDADQQDNDDERDRGRAGRRFNRHVGLGANFGCNFEAKLGDF